MADILKDFQKDFADALTTWDSPSSWKKSDSKKSGYSSTTGKIGSSFSSTSGKVGSSFSSKNGKIDSKKASNTLVDDAKSGTYKKETSTLTSDAKNGKYKKDRNLVDDAKNGVYGKGETKKETSSAMASDPRYAKQESTPKQSKKNKTQKTKVSDKTTKTTTSTTTKKSSTGTTKKTAASIGVLAADTGVYIANTDTNSIASMIQKIKKTITVNEKFSADDKIQLQRFEQAIIELEEGINKACSEIEEAKTALRNAKRSYDAEISISKEVNKKFKSKIQKQIDNLDDLRAAITSFKHNIDKIKTLY